MNKINQSINPQFNRSIITGGSIFLWNVHKTTQLMNKEKWIKSYISKRKSRRYLYSVSASPESDDVAHFNYLQNSVLNQGHQVKSRKETKTKSVCTRLQAASACLGHTKMVFDCPRSTDPNLGNLKAVFYSLFWTKVYTDPNFENSWNNFVFLFGIGHSDIHVSNF